jgi:cellulose synthase/poly-beta-1,6-N-acetylglucosamine synthase-like glycosyltransferase
MGMTNVHAAPGGVAFDLEGQQMNPLAAGQLPSIGSKRTYVQGDTPLQRTQTMGPIEGRYHPSAAEAFPAAAGVADVNSHITPGAGVGGDQQWQATQPMEPPKGEVYRKVPWQGKWLANIFWPMVVVVMAWFGVTIAYIVVRATQSLGLGKLTAYGVWVLVIEALGATTLFIYAIHLMVASHKRWEAPKVRQPFSVRVLIPCYKEDIETLEETVECAIEAAKVAMSKGMANAVHIYLCDDAPQGWAETYNGQKFSTVALRQQMIDALYNDHGIPVIRVTRNKGKGETNPKSSNLNNCLKQIYGDAMPPASEVVAVFDADQAAHNFFFTSVLPWMDAGEDVAVVQSPQVFRGVHWSDDIFNHENVGFWHYLQPAYSVMGFISCAGTNFLIRSSAFAQAGWFPTHTLTEDYALGMEMRRRGWREVYVEDELVRGSAPDKVRAAFGQRSRWCKGPYQMLFSKKSPLFAPGLNLFDRMLYLSPCYIYVVSGLATPTFMIVPLIYIWLGRFPAVLSNAVISLLIAYAFMSFFIKYYVRPGRPFLHDVRSHWNAEVSTKNFWWMYWKAAVRGSMSKLGCGNLAWKTGAGGGKANNCYTKMCEARGDLYPIMTSVVVIIFSIIFGFFQVAAGARFVGPLSISIVWAIYHLIAPLMMVLYVLFPFRHEVQHKKWWYNTGRGIFWMLCNLAFVVSTACFITAIVLAYRTKDLSAYNSGYNNSIYHIGVKETFRYIGGGPKPTASG